MSDDDEKASFVQTKQVIGRFPMTKQFAMRERWERQQAKLHGCNYLSGVCLVHGRTAPDPVANGTTQHLCSCLSFPYPHKPDEHNTLLGRFAGDTEQQRFEDAAVTDWRKERNRENRPETTPSLFDEYKSVTLQQ